MTTHVPILPTCGRNIPPVKRNIKFLIVFEVEDHLIQHGDDQRTLTGA